MATNVKASETNVRQLALTLQAAIFSCVQLAANSNCDDTWIKKAKAHVVISLWSPDHNS